MIGGVVLGSEAFAKGLRKGLKANQREQKGVLALNKGVSWPEIVKAISMAKGESWEKFRDRHGDWGRDAALWLGRRIGRLSLRQLGELGGGVDYTTVGTAVSRFHRRLSNDARLSRAIRRIEAQLLNDEM